VLFRSVYHGVAPSNVKVNKPELFASFFNAGAELISLEWSSLGLDESCLDKKRSHYYVSAYF